MASTNDIVRRPPRALMGLALCAGLFMLAYAFLPDSPDGRDHFSSIALFLVAAISASVIFVLSRRPGSWSGMPAYGMSMTVLAASRILALVDDLGSGSARINQAADLGFLIVGALFLVAARVQFTDHFSREDRREIAADVALISLALVSIIYLLLRPQDPTEAVAAIAFSVLFALTAAAAITAFIALSLWVPTPQHIGQLSVVGIFAGATLTLGTLWIRGDEPWGNPALDIPLGLATLGLAGLMIMEPVGAEYHRRQAQGGWGRPVLTSAAVLSGAISLAAVANAESQGSTSIPESSVFILLLAFAVTARILVNQVRGRQAADVASAALLAKEQALVEADGAMAQLNAALETVAESEERLRLLFEAAVDGIVELDGNGMVRRANESICVTVGLQRDWMIGRTWDEVAAAAAGNTEGLEELPEGGQARIAREGHEVFLEARTSTLPGGSGGKLILVRDVSAAKVADQTIRSLFKFLQDRDEDRSRLIKRTNAAIEAERNRIARDLHDGPVQGVSAASLSLEAVLLMIKAQDYSGARELLVALREQLSEEADSLRRLMSNLRPPILEERGLIPALKENLARFGKDTRIHTTFRSRSLVELPPDLETLAFRLVQEALSNARKHSDASELTLAVDAVAGQLRVEVADDGVGFDPSMARDYLRAGKVGLASMRERIELANGTFLIRSGPDGGTTIVATLPLEAIPATIHA